NSFADNGSYGHATNGDIASLNFLSGNPTNCYRGNANPAGLTTSPTGLEQSQPVCDGSPMAANPNVPLVSEILCGNEGALVGVSIPCPGGKPYPNATKVVMHPLPKLATMPDPCTGVPTNAFCEPPKPPKPPPPPPPPTPSGGLG